jgi:carbamoyl-phosphate synthase small subunit
MKALLTLEDGRSFDCRSFTGPGEAWGEVVFNTGMTGYQEILTDPSYAGQMVTMTYPLMGNYGVNPEDVESHRIQASALLVREYHNFYSNHRATQPLADYLKSQSILGVEQLDTRALTRHIRTAGAMRALISTSDLDPKSSLLRTRRIESMVGQDLAKKVTTKHPYRWEAGKVVSHENAPLPLNRKIWKQKAPQFSVLVIDFGIKYNILRCLEAAGFELLVVPATTDAATIREMAPDGIFLSNGPGDPEPVTYAVETIRSLMGFRPMFGICLGHQILGLALGGKTYKLKFGHRGSNQPVKNLLTGKIEITSQNHGFAVDLNSLPDRKIEITHLNLNDRTLEGFRHREYPVFAVQYHPEASPGPHDARYLFNDFRQLMKENR